MGDKGNDKIYISIIGSLLMIVFLMIGGALKWYLYSASEKEKEKKEGDSKQWEYIIKNERRNSEIDKKVIILQTIERVAREMGHSHK